MGKKYIAEFIKNECFKQNITAKELEVRVNDAICSSGEDINPPDNSTVNRWCNGKKNPSADYHSAIAVALGVSLEELRAGTRSNESKLKAEIENLSSLLNSNKQEIDIIMNVLYFDEYYCSLFSNALLASGLFFLNATLFDNIFLCCFAIIWFTIIVVKDSVSYHKELAYRQSSLDNNRSSIQVFRDYLCKDQLISQVLKVYLFVLMIVSFLPFIESLFYRGTFYITSIVYIVLGVIFLIRRIRCKY